MENVKDIKKVIIDICYQEGITRRDLIAVYNKKYNKNFNKKWCKPNS